MEKGFLGIGLVSLTVFLSSCVTTQTQVKQTRAPELKVEVTAAPVKEEVKPEAAPAEEVVAPATEAAAPAEPAPEAAAPVVEEARPG